MISENYQQGGSGPWPGLAKMANGQAKKYKSFVSKKPNSVRRQKSQLEDQKGDPTQWEGLSGQKDRGRK